MKLFFTIIISTLTFHLVLAQERTICGRLTSTEDGSPLPGVSITIKGTSTGTSTDAAGYYTIKVPIGSILVFSFIGMQTREVIVTEDNLQSVTAKKRSNEKRRTKKENRQPIPRSLYQDSIPTNKIGLATLTDESPSYNSKSNIDPSAIRSIRKTGDNYTIKSAADPVRRTGFGLQFSSSLSLEQINRLPSFQSEYAQGRPVSGNYQWIGADQQEIFSWGPQIKTLEFDGTNYPFDKRGRLVTVGSGNGDGSKKYNAFSFFKPGLANVNEMMLTLPGPKSSTFIFDIENRHRTGVIPNAEYRKTNIGTSLRNVRLSEQVSVNASISYNRSNGNLLSRGANLASIVGSVYRTPVTFDNSNALSSKSALTTNESYALSEGTKRSHAPAIADNPYGLANELPDNEKVQRLLTSFNLRYDPASPFSIVLNGNVDNQWGKTIFGSAPGYSGFTNGRLTDRNEAQHFVSAILTPAYRFELYDSELKVSVSYQTQFTARGLERTDGFGFSNESFGRMEGADSIILFNRKISRTTHEIIFNAQYEYYNWLQLRFSSRNYFSTTVNAKQFNNIFPSGSLSLNLAELFEMWSVEDFKIYTTAARTIREAPLLYSNWSYGSTNIPLENYASFYEANELLFTENLVPETETKFETGLKFRDGRLILEIAYFNNLTKDFIAPGNSAAGLALSNLATVKNYGGTVSAGYIGYMPNGSWATDLRWSKYSSVVQELYSSEKWVALAGFESVQSVLAAGKPLGAIYGTSYTRNPAGKKVIGNDGFPMEDPTLKMIGNPVPDWILGWSGSIRWKKVNFSFLFDFKNGGEIWNGTNSALDYLGRSSVTGSKRNTGYYIFDGVDVNDAPNVIPVNFSDPAKPVTENRWVRYGWDGIGEDYIENASWFRLSELVFSYTLNPGQSRIREIRFSFIGRNLFLITPYSGVDPAATLFGYATGSGLDFFNAPSTRSYGAQITIKI